MPMKNLRHILLLLSLLAFAAPQARAQLGLSGSFVNARLTDAAGGSLPGFGGAQADLTYNFAFNRFLGFNLGVGYLYLSRKEDPKIVGSYAADCYSREQHVRLPAHFTLNIPVSQNFGFVLFAGGVATYALTGLNSLSIKYENGTTGLVTYDYYSSVEGRKDMTDAQYSQAISSLDRSPDQVRYDVAAEAGFGIRITPVFMVRGSYSYGFINRCKDKSDFLRRRQISAGITLIF